MIQIKVSVCKNVRHVLIYLYTSIERQMKVRCEL